VDFSRTGMVGCEVLYDCEELVGVNHRRWWGWFCWLASHHV